MDKLTILDLAKYLPYGIKVEQNLGGSLYTSEVQAMDIDSVADESLDDLLDDDVFFIKNVRPILRPLSQLVEEITHEQETFIPLVQLARLIEESVIKMAWIPPIRKSIKWISQDDFIGLRYYSEEDGATIEFGYMLETNTFKFRYLGDNEDWRTIDNQKPMQEFLDSLHFWTGNQSYFEKGLLIEKAAK